ncbi:uncharacterized protein [Asterias amurensis]|uniref:uncharacterized protein n=1 Tax=Asterias amurensis TaxID=7602 RepID=UPI003AB7D464
MDLSEDGDSISKDECLKHYHDEMLHQAELQCEMTIRQANVKKLTEDVQELAKEVKAELLIEKWGSTLKSDGSQHEKPEQRTNALCMEVAANPDTLDDVLMKLQYEKAKLQSEVTEVMSKLKGCETM